MHQLVTHYPNTSKTEGNLETKKQKINGKVIETYEIKYRYKKQFTIKGDSTLKHHNCGVFSFFVYSESLWNPI